MSALCSIILSCTSNNNLKNNYSVFNAIPGIYTSNLWYQELLKSFEEQPDLPENHLKLSYYYANKNEWSKALDYALSGLKLDEENSDALVQAAIAYQKLGMLDEGIQVAERAYQKGYRSLDLNFTLAELLIAKGKYSAAQYYLNEITELNPNLNQSYYFKGIIALAEGDSTKALLDLKKFIDSDATNLLSIELLADLLFQKGEWNESIKYGQKGLGFNNSNKLKFILSKDFFMANQVDSGWKYLNLAIKDSAFKEGLGYAGEQYFKSKNYPSAIQCFLKEEKISPSLSHTLWIAEAYQNIGQIENAREYYTTMVESDTNNIVAVKALEKLNRNARRNVAFIPDPTKYLPMEQPILDDTIQY